MCNKCFLAVLAHALERRFHFAICAESRSVAIGDFLSQPLSAFAASWQFQISVQFRQFRLHIEEMSENGSGKGWADDDAALPHRISISPRLETKESWLQESLIKESQSPDMKHFQICIMAVRFEPVFFCVEFYLLISGGC